MPIRLPIAALADTVAVVPALAPARADGLAGGRAEAELVGDGDGEGERLLQVGELAKAAGKTVRAIHHYEEVGLLTPHARSKGRYRLYDQAALARIRWIGKLHDLGLSLAQIQAIVSTWERSPSAPHAMAHIKSIYAQKLEETRAQIAHLSSLERELVASIAYLDTCDRCEPDEIVDACTACSHHEPNERAPELVSGIHASRTCGAAKGHAPA